MSVTFRDYGDHSVGTQAGSGGTPSDPSQLIVSRFSPTEIDFNMTQSGVTYTLAFTGQFDTGSVGFTPLTLADLQKTNLGTTAKVTGFIVSQAGTYFISESFSPSISFNQFSPFSDQTLAGLTSVLSGNDVYYTSADATSNSGAYYLYGGNDTLYENHKVLKYSDVFYGGDGIDTAVMPGKRSNYTVVAGTVWDNINSTNSLPGYTITDSTKAINTLQINQVERVQYSDGTLALDIAPGQNSGEVYRLYQAAFARTPDMPGVKYHLNDMESKGLPLWQIASNFLASPEFASKYGSNPTDTQYINALYQNVLKRTPGASEVSWYQNQFNTHQMDRQAALIGFSESPENVALVGSAIANGIWLG